MKHLFFLRMVMMLSVISSFTSVFADSVTQNWIEANYQKQEFMIPMRDGVRLYTAVYSPRKISDSPLLLMRTPYSCGNYGSDYEKIANNYMCEYLQKGYIYVKQDVRGRFRSEGVFEHIKPVYSKLRENGVDEATDVYDTVEWLLNNLSGHNGRVGILGNSYSGFYALMGGLSDHPAIKAISPQAPVVDWFVGDDFHQNGALKLIDAFHFHNSFGKPHYGPTERYPATVRHYTTDEYSFFLQKGPLPEISSLLGDSISFWPDMMEHPNYDEWWQERNYLRYCKDLRIPTLIVGGFYDAEDAYGAFSLYKYLAGNASGSQVHLTAGPWSHGQWRKKNADRLGNLSFGENTAIWFQDSIEIPFFEYYLRDRGDIRNLHKVAVHLSGSNRKINPGQWPPKDLKEVTYYLHPGGNLKKEAVKTETNTTYISDPHHPVPYTDRIASRRVAEYMTADQRFAASRSDVITYRSEPLSQEVTVLGPVGISLRAAISTTDADFVVKIIDEYPDPSGPNNELSGYQLLIRGEVMRGRYRKGLSNPIPFTPGRAEDICWQTVDIGHTFQKGHRIVVQIQSSWFPLIDRNPQQFVNIYQCGISDFIPSQIRITEGGTYGSSIKFSCLP